MTDEPEQDSPPNEQSPEESADAPQHRNNFNEDLKKILVDHLRWLESDGLEGRVAKLRKANLQKAVLEGANLQEAWLGGANLQKAFLEYANLQKAELEYANLQKANLGGANLQKAKLEGANLQEALLMDANLQKAKLREANLQKADLREANLQEAVLEGVDFQKADLGKANLQKADLREANLQKGKFNRSILREANFQDADLADAIGLLASQFAGAIVSGAKLPPDIKKFEGLIQVEEISKSAKKLFISMLLGCIYAWLTIATTTDPHLLTNSASSPLPIIQAPIPIAHFYVAAPLILFSLYLWLHFYLQDLWKELADLPAIFPDGKPLDEKAYPWILTCLVRPHFALLQGNRPPLSYLKVGLSILLAWWIVPFTFVLFWLRYLPRHDWVGTAFHILFLAVALFCAMRLHHLMKMTLRGERPLGAKLEKIGDGNSNYSGLIGSVWQYYAAGIVVLGVAFVISDGAINGTEPGLHRQYIPELLQDIGFKVHADFTEQDVSTKPANWFMRGDQELPRLTHGAQLKSADLRHVQGFRAFLVNADLRNAKLKNGSLIYANLENARLFGAKLQNANLGKANLKNAELQAANLQGARLGGADFKGAKLEGADFRGADLMGALNLTREQMEVACADKTTKGLEHFELKNLDKHCPP